MGNNLMLLVSQTEDINQGRLQLGRKCLSKVFMNQNMGIIIAMTKMVKMGSKLENCKLLEVYYTVYLPMFGNSLRKDLIFYSSYCSFRVYLR